MLELQAKFVTIPDGVPVRGVKVTWFWNGIKIAETYTDREGIARLQVPRNLRGKFVAVLDGSPLRDVVWASIELPPRPLATRTIRPMRVRVAQASATTSSIPVTAFAQMMMAFANIWSSTMSFMTAMISVMLAMMKMKPKKEKT